MTVAELIAALKEYPQDLPVYMYLYGEEKECEEMCMGDAYGCGENCVQLS